ncbi:MAG: quinone-dependent dihydroorotate dehydrogenase [Chitinophagaceae bacterium]|nr:quinone-dependent dihydroorotate dehydrogenase [Chitinophagaceae bacterium]
MYKLVRSIFFWFDAEAIHYFAMDAMRIICSVKVGREILSKMFKPASKETTIWNLKFTNPVGLAAGFDKNAKYLRELQALGFGFVEIGTVTPIGQKGNDKPRLFRLPADRALINRMGFNNDGVSLVVERLKQWKLDRDSFFPNARLIIGGNIGKNKVTLNEDAWKDYETCFVALFDWVDYFVVNVSSPNTPGLRDLQEKDSLRKILSHLQVLNKQHVQPKPLLLKIAPDLTQSQIDDVIDLAMEIELDGLVASNTTISREGLVTSVEQLNKIGAGGLSGKPLAKRSTEILKYIQQKTSGQLPVIASGGIFTQTDAKEKWNAGAQLVQVWTGFIYEGPGIVKKMLDK